MIISAFAGSGKSYATKQLENAIDLESSDFQWIYEDNVTDDVEARKGIDNRKKNPNFIKDYVDAIEKVKDEYYQVFIAAQPAVLEELANRNIPFAVAYPTKNSKDTYIQRYIDRGNNEQFVNLMDTNFYNFVDDMMNNKVASKHIVIEQNKHLLDYLVD